MLNKIQPNSNFTRNVLTLMTGTTVAQAIPIAISPILTRIYTPNDFGVFTIFLALCTIFGAISNGKYELAIMLPKKDEDAINIFALGFFLNLIISVSLFIIVLIFDSKIINILGNQEIKFWLYLVPFTVFFMGIFNILNYFNNRKQYYKDLAKANILKSIILAVFQLLIGFLKEGASGLISGQILSTMFANFNLLNNILKNKTLLSNVSKQKIIIVARKYKNFPKYTLWAVLANTLSQHLVSILISMFYSTAILGFYSLCQRVLGVPLVLIASSIEQVFFQEASEEKRETGSCINTFNSTVKKLIIVGFPIFFILYFVVEDIFVIVFGKNWLIAGTYAKSLIPLFFIRFVVSPLTIMNQINLKNKLGMLWQFGLLFIYIFILYLGKHFNLEFIQILNLFSIIVTLYYMYFGFLIYSHVKGNE